MSHTPAPWHIQSIETGAVYGSAGRIVASVYGDDPDCRRDARLDANSRLIAAAPDLLEALKLLLADLDGYEAWERPCHAVDVARAAIAKATEEPSECSICRRIHGGEITHECE